MLNTIIEVIKANKKGIIKGSLIIGGTVAGLAIAMKTMLSETEDEVEELVPEEDEEITEDEVTVETEDI